MTDVMSLQRDALERETVYSLLADRVREELLRYLSITDRTTASEAAQRIAERQPETTAVTFDADQTAVLVQLVHNHLPRLSQYDVVEYDSASGEITPGPNFEVLEPYLSDPEAPIDSR